MIVVQSWERRIFGRSLWNQERSCTAVMLCRAPYRNVSTLYDISKDSAHSIKALQRVSTSMIQPNILETKALGKMISFILLTFPAEDVLTKRPAPCFKRLVFGIVESSINSKTMRRAASYKSKNKYYTSFMNSKLRKLRFALFWTISEARISSVCAEQLFGDLSEKRLIFWTCRLLCLE